MGETRTVEAGELDTEAMLDLLESGHRLVVETEFLGSKHEVTLRHDGDTYYCDTPTRLRRHNSADGMRACIRNQGYARE